MAEAPLTRRVDLNLGYSCNIECRFCYYLESVEARRKDRDLSTAEAKRLLGGIRRQGLEIVDLTGGEPTLRQDLPELARYAKEIGFRSVALITNGLRLAQPGYAQQLVASGIDDFLFSLHGPTAEMHDALTRRPGSYEALLRGIEKVRALGVKIRSNTVVTGLNVDALEPLAERLAELGFRTVNFILFNPIVEAGNADAAMNVEYRRAGRALARVLDQWAGRIPTMNVRYLPFCCLPGGEAAVTNMQQLQYDADEWDYLVRTRIREGWWIGSAAMLAGMLLLPSWKAAWARGYDTARHWGIKRFLEVKNKVKGPACRHCAVAPICGGVWKNYARWKGFGELTPYPGEKVYDPLHFRRR